MYDELMELGCGRNFLNSVMTVIQRNYEAGKCN